MWCWNMYLKSVKKNKNLENDIKYSENLDFHFHNYASYEIALWG